MLSLIRKPLVKYSSWLATTTSRTFHLANRVPASRKGLDDVRRSSFEQKFSPAVRQFQTSSALLVNKNTDISTLFEDNNKEMFGDNNIDDMEKLEDKNLDKRKLLEDENVEKKLLETLTPEFCLKLTGRTTSKKFKLKSIVSELEKLYRKNFPLPESLTEEQWQILMEFNSPDLRIYYLDSIVQGVDELQKLRDLDSASMAPLKVPPELLDDPERREKLRQIQFEHERLRQVGEQVPSVLTKDQWHALMSCPGSRQILQSFRHFGKKRYHRLNKLIEKRATLEDKLIIREQERARRLDEEHIVYGLGHNNIFLRMYKTKVEGFENSRVIWNFHEWGQPLVIDLSFLKMLTYHEVNSLCYREIPFGLNMNKASKNPLPVYIVNFDRGCNKCKILHKAYPNLFNPDFPAVVTEKSYLDLFPPERLVYLTPDSRTDLCEYNADDVYIVGGIVEMANDVPYTLSKAKKQGIRHARLPIKRTVGIAPILNVDHVIAILNDFTHTRDWFYSFRWIPPRFFKNRLKSSDYTSEQEQIFFAQRSLNPNSFPNLFGLTPKEYRAKYVEIMRQADKSDDFRPDPAKYKFQGRIDREKRMYGIFSGLE